MVSARSRNTGDLAHKKRAKQVQRTRDRYDRELAQLTSLLSDSHKFNARFPLRMATEAHGIYRLTKSEAKEDERFIAKDTLLATVSEGNEEESQNLAFQRSARPSVSEESSLLHKVTRLKGWLSRPEETERDLAKWRGLAQQAKASLRESESAEDDWCLTFERSRRLCQLSLRETERESERLRAQSAALLSLCRQECLADTHTHSHSHSLAVSLSAAVASTHAHSAGKRAASSSSSFSQKELVGELVRRESLLREKRELAASLLHREADRESERRRVPVVSLSAEEIAVHTQRQQQQQEESQAHTHVSSGIVGVKRERDSEIETGVERDEDDLRALSRSLLQQLQQLSEYVQRSEAQEHSLEGVFASSALSLAAEDELSSSLPASLTPLQALLHRELCEDIKVKKENTKENNTNSDKNESEISLSSCFLSLRPSSVCSANNTDSDSLSDTEREQRLRALLNKVFSSPLDPATGYGTRKKRKAHDTHTHTATATGTANAMVSLRSFAFHRTERGLPLRLSPASACEDKFIGLLRENTLFRPDNTHTTRTERTYTVADPVPATLTALEDEIMARLQLQSEIACASTMIDRLRVSLADNEKMLAEAQIAKEKALTVQQQVIEQDAREREKMRQDLVQYGFLPSEGNDLVKQEEDSNTNNNSTVCDAHSQESALSTTGMTTSCEAATALSQSDAEAHGTSPVGVSFAAKTKNGRTSRTTQKR